MRRARSSPGASPNGHAGVPGALSHLDALTESWGLSHGLEPPCLRLWHLNFGMVAVSRPAGRRGEGALAPTRRGRWAPHPAGEVVRWGQGPPDSMTGMVPGDD